MLYLVYQRDLRGQENKKIRIIKATYHPDKHGIPVNKMLKSIAVNPITASSNGVGDNLHLGISC